MAQLEHIEAIEAMIEALEDEDSRGLVRLGIILAQMEDFQLAQIVWTCVAASVQVKAPSPMAITDILTDGVNEKLDKVQEQLQAELQNWVSIPMTR